MTISLGEDTLFSVFSSSSIHAYCLLVTEVYVHLTSSYSLVDIHLFSFEVAADRTSRTFGQRQCRPSGAPMIMQPVLMTTHICILPH